VRVLALSKRRAPPAILYSDHMKGAEGEAMFRHACAMGLEGIISKPRRQPLQEWPVPQLGEGEEPGYERR